MFKLMAPLESREHLLSKKVIRIYIFALFLGHLFFFSFSDIVDYP